MLPYTYFPSNFTPPLSTMEDRLHVQYKQAIHGKLENLIMESRTQHATMTKLVNDVWHHLESA